MKSFPKLDFQVSAKINHDVDTVPSHNVITDTINAKGQDYRFQESEHPVKELRDRKVDNVNVGR